MKHIIDLQNIEKSYKLKQLEVPVLHNIHLQVNKGEMIALVGPSGSGKSTLMNIIGLLDRPTSGNYLLEGKEINLNMSDHTLALIRAEKIGFIFQSFNLLPKQTALDNVILPSIYKTRKSQAKNKALQLLKKVGLEHRIHHKPTEMSGGEKQRIAIARSLINDPDIILADEPTGNLDSKSGQHIIDILKQLNQEGKTILMITHDEKIAAQCQKTVHIFDGQLTGGENV